MTLSFHCHEYKEKEGRHARPVGVVTRVILEGWRKLNEFEALGNFAGLSAVGHVQFVVEVFDVTFDRIDRYNQRFSDLRVAATGNEEGEDASLLRGERFEQGRLWTHLVRRGVKGLEDGLRGNVQGFLSQGGQKRAQQARERFALVEKEAQKALFACIGQRLGKMPMRCLAPTSWSGAASCSCGGILLSFQRRSLCQK